MVRKLIYNFPKFKGKQRLLSLIDDLLGPDVLRGRLNINYQGYYSSIQDSAFLRIESENSVLETLINALPEEGIFIDIGANFGYYSALAAKVLGINGIVISVEPSHREYKRLLYSISSNKHVCSWLPINQAFGEKGLIGKLNIDSRHTGVNYITGDEYSNYQMCLVDEAYKTLGAIIPADRIINLIKIDVEGYEMSVLKGMYPLLIDRKIDKLQIEITDKFLERAGSSKKELYAFMNKMGYKPIIKSDDWQYNEVFERMTNSEASISI